MGREANCRAETHRLRTLMRAGAITPEHAGETYRKFRRPHRRQESAGTRWQKRVPIAGKLYSHEERRALAAKARGKRR